MAEINNLRIDYAKIIGIADILEFIVTKMESVITYISKT